MPALSRAPKLLLGCYLLVAVVEIAASSLPASWASGAGLASAPGFWHGLDTVCLAVLMPLLAGFLLLARPRRDRLTGWVLVALAFAWAGDTVGGFTLLAKIGFFLVAQIAYAVAFWPYRRRSLVRHPTGLAIFVLCLVGLAVLVGRAAGALLPAIMVYAVALGTMTVLASGLNRVVAAGGIVFLVSDLTIGLTIFDLAGARLQPLLDALIMPTYLLAQLLLVGGVLRQQRTQTLPPAGASPQILMAPDPDRHLLGPGRD